MDFEDILVSRGGHNEVSSTSEYVKPQLTGKTISKNKIILKVNINIS